MINPGRSLSCHHLTMRSADKFQPLNPSLRFLAQSFVVGVLTAGGLISGLAPDLTQPPAATLLKVAVNAQVVSNADVTNYARSVLAIEPIRQAAYNDIKKIISSGTVPPIVCNKPDTLKALPSEDARRIAANYCTRSAKIVESFFGEGKSARFNEMTQSLAGNPPADPALRQRIQDEMLRLQQESMTR